MADIRQIEELIKGRGRSYEDMIEFVSQDLKRFQLEVRRRETGLKTIVSIAEKIDRKRRTEDPEYSLPDVPDIAAIRIVCLFPDGVTKVIKHLKERYHLDVPSDIKNKTGWVHRKDGFRGYVFYLSLEKKDLNSNPQFEGLKMEVQLMTVLQNAWTDISHDLVYKKEGEIEKEYVPHLKSLSGYLEGARDHVHQIRNDIMKKRAAEKKFQEPEVWYYLERAKKNFSRPEPTVTI